MIGYRQKRYEGIEMREGQTESQSRIESIQEEISDLLLKFPDIGEAWKDRNVQKLLAKLNTEWISQRDWKIFVTLTFENDVARDVAIKKFKWLVKELNKDVFGNNYTSIVGHSYFSYVLGIEKQSRGVYHFHVLTDKPVHFKLINTLWNRWAGFARPEEIVLVDHAVRYVTKYVSKGGEIDPYFSETDIEPLILPDWWKTESQVNLD